MKLEELLKELKRKLLIDDTLKAYLYNNRIEIIDFTLGYKDDKVDIDDFYGNIINIYMDGNRISYIDPIAFNLITRSNKNTISYLCNLLDKEISDYNNYDKLADISDLKSIDI